MPEGYGYPKGEAILGKIKQGDLGADVALKNIDYPKGSGKEHVQESLFKLADEKDY